MVLYLIGGYAAVVARWKIERLAPTTVTYSKSLSCAIAVVYHSDAILHTSTRSIYPIQHTLIASHSGLSSMAVPYNAHCHTLTCILLSNFHLLDVALVR